MPTNFPKGVSSYGLALPSEGLPLTKGNIFHVDSGHVQASDTHDGVDPARPLATIDGAIGKCAANQGDIILVSPGHTETIIAAGGIAVDVAGISIIGLGRGSLKPTITLGTSAAADINVTADNILLKNLRLVNNIDSLVNFIDADEDWLFLEDIDFITSSTKEALGFVNCATTKDNLFIRRCTALQPTDPAGTDGGDDTGFLYVVDSENIYIEDCFFYGNFETAIFHNKTTACKNLWVKYCYGIQLLSGAEPFQLVDGADGAMVGGGFITPAEAAASEATLVGTLGAKFFILAPANFGNDGGAGGQGGSIIATAS